MRAAAGLLAAAALITLAVAASAVAKTPPRYGSQHRVVYTAPWPSSPIITPRYLYFPGGKPDPNAMPDPGTCTPTGVNCSVEELCEMWGEC